MRVVGEEYPCGTGQRVVRARCSSRTRDIIRQVHTLLLLISVATVLAGADQDSVLPRVAAHSDRFGAISRQIWESPELGFQESKSSVLLQQELRASGFVVQAGVAGMPTAFTASYGAGKPVIVGGGEKVRQFGGQKAPVEWLRHGYGGGAGRRS